MKKEIYFRKIKRIKGILSILLTIMTFVSFSACGHSLKQEGTSGVNTTEESVESRYDTGFVAASYDSFDSADTAIFMRRDAQEQTVTLWNTAVGRTYTLSYDGTTRFADKYGESISLAQINPGDVVDVKFLKAQKHLTTMAFSSEVWSLEKVTFFELDSVLGQATVGQETKKYKLTANTHFFSEGKAIDIMELNPADTLSFQGIDTEILSVRVEKGHGYLRLTGQEKFVGGWMEIGQSDIIRIEEEMLLPLAEGSYRILVSKDGNSGEKTAVIRRNEETVLDISDLEVAEPEVGTILFSLTPESAKLYVDGEKADASLPVSLVYGIHQIMVKADGYQTLTQYVRVGQPSAGLDIALDPVNTDTSEESTEAQTDVTTDYYKVYVDAPSGAEVYLDGSYVGISPCSFRKVEGAHVVTLRKTGYQTKSYTLQINGEEKDISYSFAELESNTSSGANPLDGNADLNSVVSEVLGSLFE